MDVEVRVKIFDEETGKKAANAIKRFLEHVYGEKAEYIKKIILYDYEAMKEAGKEFTADYDVSTRTLQILPLFDEYVTLMLSVATTIYRILVDIGELMRNDNVFEALYSCARLYSDVLTRISVKYGIPVERLEEMYVNALSDVAMATISYRGAEMTLQAPMDSKIKVEDEYYNTVMKMLRSRYLEDLYEVFSMCCLSTVEVAVMLSRTGIKMGVDVNILIPSDELEALRTIAKQNTSLAYEEYKRQRSIS